MRDSCPVKTGDRSTRPLTSEIQNGTAYSEQPFSDVRLGGERLTESEFYDCTFTDCSFVEATLKRCRFVHCTFRDCNLSLVRLADCVIADTTFEACRLVGIDWTQASWSAMRLGEPLRFVDCDLNHSTFIGLALQGLVLKDCRAVDVDFREADLTGANFIGTDFNESLFLHTDLTRADLSAARNYRISPTQNTVTKAKFSLPEALSLLYSMDIELIEEA